MSPDLFAIHMKQRARRTAASPAEYAASVQRYRRPVSWGSRVCLAAAAVILLAVWGLQ